MQVDTITCANALDWLRTLPDESVNCIVTSPPYFNLRSYLPDGHPDKSAEIGLEDTMQAYLERMVAVFREARRVLRSDGVAWVNMGDSYAAHGSGAAGKELKYQGETVVNRKARKPTDGLKPKDRMMIPARLAIALCDDGWYLRDEIVWHKPNPMPESVTDRTTKAHEMVYLLAKSERYWYDADAIREPAQDWGQRDRSNGKYTSGIVPIAGGAHGGLTNGDNALTGRNKRSMWTVATKPTPFAHFATFPQKLIEPMILAGCPAQVCSEGGEPYERVTETEPMIIRRTDRSALGQFGRTQSSGTMLKPSVTHTLGFCPTCNHAAAPRPGIVLDMFMGSGTVALVAMRLGRHYIGCDISQEYVDLANRRLATADPYTSTPVSETEVQLSLFEELK